MNNHNCSALDLAMDEYFQRWVLSNDLEADEYWSTWLELYPHQRAVVREAKQLILLHNYQTDHWPSERKQAVLDQIRSTTGTFSEQQNLLPSQPFSLIFYRHWLLLGVCFSTIVIGAAVWQLLKSSYLDYRTDYGETREVMLPDGSIVVLNANSSVRFQDDWQQPEEREVWLDGEAFFQVKPVVFEDQDGPVKFVVHTNSLTIEAVGTAFNVSYRKGLTDVYLEKGSINLRVDGGESCQMKPGEQVNISLPPRKLSRKKANVAAITAWRQHQIILDNQPLSDVVDILANYYGVKVDFYQPQLAHKRLAAVLPTNNLDTALITLEAAAQVRAERKDSYVLFK